MGRCSIRKSRRTTISQRPDGKAARQKDSKSSAVAEHVWLDGRKKWMWEHKENGSSVRPSATGKAGQVRVLPAPLPPRQAQTASGEHKNPVSARLTSKIVVDVPIEKRNFDTNTISFFGKGDECGWKN
jgi:hypothetical protein